MAVSLVSYNIQFGRGKDGRCDIERIAKEISAADVIAMQEVDRHWPRSDMADQVALLNENLPDHYCVYGPGIDLDAIAGDGAPPNRARRRQFGNLLLSRYPILSARTHFLPKHALHGLVSLQRTALEGVIDFPQGPIRIYAVHLAHVSRNERHDQIARLLEIHREAPLGGGVRSGAHAEWDAQGPPPPMPAGAVLLGDFNMTPDSAEYTLIAGYDDPKYGRVATASEFIDAWLAVGGDPAGGFTKLEETRSRRIDYAFVSIDLADRVRSVHVDLEAQGSDHQPLWVDMD
jgi:endonuclease/exonuclease/phosphatase family metal-dependent hydrolase